MLCRLFSPNAKYFQKKTTKAKAGNDRWYMFYGSSVRNPDSRLMKALSWNKKYYSGQITFEVKRNGKTMQFTVTPELKKIILFEDYYSIFK